MASYQFVGMDLDADNGGFTWEIAEGDLGDNMSIDASGRFIWTPQIDEAGPQTVKVRLILQDGILGE